MTEKALAKVALCRYSKTASYWPAAGSIGQFPFQPAWGETMDTGRDTGVPVTKAPAGQADFEGEIHEIRIQTGQPKILPF